jgi:hypothetical protein
LEALDLKKAYNEVIEASTLQPVTKFPEISLVLIYINTGKINEAIILLKELLAAKDFSWMLYFGINKNIYYSELYRYLSISYEFKRNQINFSDKYNFISNLFRPFKKIYYKVLTYFYNFKAANLYIKIGEANIKGGGELEGLYQLYNAYERIWPTKAYKVLKLAEKIEVKSNTRKQKIYNIKKAIIKEKSSFFYSRNKKKKELLKNLKLLDKKWERFSISETLLEIVKSSKGKEKDKYITELFKIHSPILVMNNIKVKMNIVFSGEDLIKNKKKVINNLKKRGIIYSPKSKIKFEISNLSDDNFYINIYDNGLLFKSDIISIDKKEKKIYEILTLEIFNKIFKISLDN